MEIPGGKMFGKPEILKAPPNIPSSGGAEADNENRDLDLYRLLQMGGRGATNITAEFGESLKGLESNKSPEAIEKVANLYSEMVEESMGAIFDLYEKDIKTDEKNAYPYDYRSAEFMQENIKQAITSLERMPEIKKSEETLVFISELKQDLMWLDSFLHTTVAQSASLPYKFDVVLQMQLLKEGRYCAFVTNDDMEALMYAEIPGTELTPNQIKLKQAKKIGIAVPQEYTKIVDEGGNPKEGKPLVEGPTNLREMAVKMYAASFKMRMNLAAASQADLANDNPEATTFKGTNLSKHEFAFYITLFWDKGEAQFLTPYVTSKGDQARDYTTLLEASLITNAYYRLKEIVASTTFDDTKKTEMVDSLAKEVKAEALSRKAGWRTRQSKDVVSMLATLITQQGLTQDFAYGHSAEYCYAYQWNTDADGIPTSKRKVEIGGIYSMSGDLPSLGFARRKHEYDGMSNSCTKFLLPTSSAGRKEVSMCSPYEMPHFDIESCQDEFLVEQWKFLFSDEDQYVREREGMGYKSLHPDIARQLKDWAFRWKTPFTSKYLVNVNDRDSVNEYELEVPHLMQPHLGNISNFFDSITLDPEKLNFGGKSVWEELVDGKETYEIEWGKLETQAHSRWKVDLDMASRYMKVLIEPVDESKDPILSLIWAEPGTFGPKEIAKRLRLSKRDDEDAPPTAHEIALIPFMIVMACAEKHGISSAYGWTRNTKEDKESNTSNADRFFVEMAYWKRALKWLPRDRAPKDKYDNRLDYGNEMALLAEFYEAVLSRVMKASSEESFYLAKTNLEKTAGRINKMGHLNQGAFSYTVNTNKALQK